jgi:hypothetical protein
MCESEKDWTTDTFFARLEEIVAEREKLASDIKLFLNALADDELEDDSDA